MQPTAPTKIFTFKVADDGKFEYDPPDDWAYNHKDWIQFRTDSGPFTIDFIPASPIPIANFNPLGGPLKSVPDGNGHKVDTHVKDNLTDRDRKLLMDANKQKHPPDGIVGRYLYEIEVQVNGQTRSDKHKNGTYSC